MEISTRVSLSIICLLLSQFGIAFAADEERSCEHHVAQWLDPASGEVLQVGQVFDRLASTRIVLLGEAHTTAAHHRWQQYMLAALHSRHANLIVGFEMLPRRAQAVLDAWTAGKLTEKEFLEQSQWQKVWGYDAGLYLPLLNFVRLNRLPAIALNIDRELVSLVGQQGWQALSDEQRMGLAEPAPASDDYRETPDAENETIGGAVTSTPSGMGAWICTTSSPASTLLLSFMSSTNTIQPPARSIPLQLGASESQSVLAQTDTLSPVLRASDRARWKLDTRSFTAVLMRFVEIRLPIAGIPTASSTATTAKVTINSMRVTPSACIFPIGQYIDALRQDWHDLPINGRNKPANGICSEIARRPFACCAADQAAWARQPGHVSGFLRAVTVATLGRPV